MDSKNKLKQYANNKYSQFGEDGIIKKVFDILPKKDENWCVEFGAADGKFLSNTYDLIANNNWKGVLIEGNLKKIPALRQAYEGNSNAVLISSLVSFEGVDTLDNILVKTDIPVDFDLLSIDVDGNDFHIWESLKNYKPKVVLIEFNPSIPSDIEFVQEKKYSVNQGSSLLSLIKLGKLKGYELIGTTICNGIFVRKEFYELFEINENSITSMWDTEIPAPRVFQLIDGTLVLSREFKLLWHNKNVKKFDLQVLPKYMRYIEDSPINGIYKKILRKIYYKLQSIKKRK